MKYIWDSDVASRYCVKISSQRKNNSLPKAQLETRRKIKEINKKSKGLEIYGGDLENAKVKIINRWLDTRRHSHYSLICLWIFLWICGTVKWRVQFNNIIIRVTTVRFKKTNHLCLHDNVHFSFELSDVIYTDLLIWPFEGL